jgi:hypothetical protein
MVKRNTKLPHEFVCVTDDAKGIDKDIRVVPLWENPCPNYGDGKRPNCFYRLRAFAPEMGELFGERFIWLDLDCIITGSIDHLIDMRTDFAIWRPDGERMPCNGSLVAHKTGTRIQIWTRFDKRRIHPTRGLRGTGMCGSDQAWIALNLKSTDEFIGQKDGVYSWRSHIDVIEQNRALPNNASIVFFNGGVKPWDLVGDSTAPWIQEHYR